jgi:hypothetical protein
MIIHFKINKLTQTPCGNKDIGLPKNINWDKVTCTQCLTFKDFLKKKRHS